MILGKRKALDAAGGLTDIWYDQSFKDNRSDRALEGKLSQSAAKVDWGEDSHDDGANEDYDNDSSDFSREADSPCAETPPHYIPS